MLGLSAFSCRPVILVKTSKAAATVMSTIEYYPISKRSTLENAIYSLQLHPYPLSRAESLPNPLLDWDCQCKKSW